MTPTQLRALVAHIEANTTWLGSLITFCMSFAVPGWLAWAFAAAAALLAAAGWGRDRSARRLTAQAEEPVSLGIQRAMEDVAGFDVDDDDGRGGLARIRRYRRGDT